MLDQDNWLAVFLTASQHSIHRHALDAAQRIEHDTHQEGHVIDPDDTVSSVSQDMTMFEYIDYLRQH